MSKFFDYIKRQFGKDQLFYTIILLVSIAFIVTNRCFVGFGSILWIADIGTLFGVLNIIYTAKHTVWGLIFNTISSAFIVTTSLIQHVWFNATITLAINIPFLIVGTIKWFMNEKKHKEEKNLKVMSKKNFWLLNFLLIIVCAIFTVILYFLNGNLFYLDALFTSLCLLGVILSSNMYREQFYYFIAGNLVGAIMFAIMSFQTLNNLPYVFLLTIDFIVAIKGLVNWTKLWKIQEQKKQENIANE